MSLQSEATLAELRRAAASRHTDHGRAGRDHDQALDLDEDEAPEAVDGYGTPAILAAITMLGAAIVGFGVWSWLGAS